MGRKLIFLFLMLFLVSPSLSGDSEKEKVGNMVKDFYRALLMEGKSCVKVVKRFGAVSLMGRVFLPISEKQAKEFCKQREKVVRSFGKVRDLDIIKVVILDESRGYVILKLKHLHPYSHTQVNQSVVRIGKRWFVLM